MYSVRKTFEFDNTPNVLLGDVCLQNNKPIFDFI